MGFEIINKIKRERGLTNPQIAKMSGVTLSTLDKITSGVNKNPKLDTLQAICKVLGCTLNDFVDSPPTKNAASELTEAARSVAKKYDTLDGHGKKMVDIVLDEETSRMQAEATQIEAEQEPVLPRTKVIPLLGASFAAGPGEPDFGNLWTNYEVDADNKAEFAIRITGDSMEPYLHDGEIAFGLKHNPQDGEVGAFLLDGEFLCKQYCMDSFGNVYLFSLNRRRSDADKTIMRSGDRTLYCFGTIILKNCPPLPGR